MDEEGQMEEKNLAKLPVDVLNLVVERLCFPDVFRFGCVSKQWETVCDPLQFRNHLPWLIVPFTNTNTFSMSHEDMGIVGFYSLRNGKLYKAELPELSKRRICGSFPGGWLMTLHENSQVQLFNPLTALPSLIDLPPLTTFPGVHPNIEPKEHTEDGIPTLCYKFTRFNSDGPLSYTSTYMRDTFIHKVAASSSSITKGTIIVAIQSPDWALAFYRIGGDQHVWTPATPNKGGLFWDLTYYKGKFYAVDHSGVVFVFHGLEEAASVPVPYSEKVISCPAGGNSDQYYILESAGDLFVVLRRIEVEYDPSNKKLFSTLVFPHKTVGFKVFKVVFGTPNSWVEVESLGDRSLFLGYNSSFSIPFIKFSGCKPSRIYFTDDNMRCMYAKKFGGYDLGIFNIQDGTIENILYSSDNFLVMPPPIWFAPYVSS